jgi:F-type H+-transporting ATPase subunit epsilon
MADTLDIEIVTPERLLVSDKATEVQVPGLSGYLGVLPGHAPLITELKSGEFSYRKPDGTVQRIALHWGFAEILPNKVTVLAERAEKPDEIDVEKARRELQGAEAQLQDPNADREQALRLIERATTQISVAGRHDGSMLNLVP